MRGCSALQFFAFSERFWFEDFIVDLFSQFQNLLTEQWSNGAYTKLRASNEFYANYDDDTF